MSPFLPSTERDFISVTTANLSHDQLQQLSDEVGGERSLLVVCSAFRGRKDGYGNLTVKKIPKTVLSRCEWGKDDYSLKVENLPKANTHVFSTARFRTQCVRFSQKRAPLRFRTRRVRNLTPRQRRRFTTHCVLNPTRRVGNRI
jgi:hypothetical protein